MCTCSGAECTHTALHATCARIVGQNCASCMPNGQPRNPPTRTTRQTPHKQTPRSQMHTTLQTALKTTPPAPAVRRPASQHPRHQVFMCKRRQPTAKLLLLAAQLLVSLLLLLLLLLLRDTTNARGRLLLRLATNAQARRESQGDVRRARRPAAAPAPCIRGLEPGVKRPWCMPWLMLWCMHTEGHSLGGQRRRRARQERRCSNVRGCMLDQQGQQR